MTNAQNLTIRRAEANDLPALVSFNQAMALETENKQLDGNTLVAGVGRLLEEDFRGFYLVAERQQSIVGSLMVTYEWSDWRNANFWWIQSVYVHPENRRSGIYAALYQEVQWLAKQQGDVCGFRLYVEKDNQIAKRTYEKLGMAECQYNMYESQK